MTTPRPEAAPPAEQDLCPHCGAVLQLQRALHENRSVLGKGDARAPLAPAPPAEPEEP